MNKPFLLLSVLLFLCVREFVAQQKIFGIGISLVKSMPHTDAALELESLSKGELFSCVALESLNCATSLGQDVVGRMLFNTRNSSLLSLGIYYSNGVKLNAVAGAMDLKTLFSSREAITSLGFDLDIKRFQCKDQNENMHTLNLASIVQDSWCSLNTNTGAVFSQDNRCTQGWGRIEGGGESLLRL